MALPSLHVEICFLQIGNSTPVKMAIKKSELLLFRKNSDFIVVVHLQGLEPWAH